MSEANTDSMIRQKTPETQFNLRNNTAEEITTLNNANNPIQVKDEQVDLHTFEKNIVKKVLNEVDKVMTSVESKKRDAILTAIENLVKPRAELAMKSVDLSSGRGVHRVVFDADRRDIKRNVEGLLLTAPIKVN